jgi:hypothetical protein
VLGSCPVQSGVGRETMRRGQGFHRFCASWGDGIGADGRLKAVLERSQDFCVMGR